MLFVVIRPNLVTLDIVAFSAALYHQYITKSAVSATDVKPGKTDPRAPFQIDPLKTDLKNHFARAC